MTGRFIALFLPLVFHLVAMAQDPLPPATQAPPSVKCRFENAADSLAYLHFTAGLSERPPELPMDTSTAGLRMAWRASEFGDTWYVKRGDGSPLRALEIRPFHMRLPALTAEGKRVLQVVEEYPCALTCHTVWYFVAE
jgi:hypothetical protein